ncbi:hypothetical protein Cgig2_018008 [Carnegiea gigantea]|uniref:Uncharacterized protein n=1 Tax=Carnegiea gigantea TaxID=171969 RepID=A0A9Q1JFU8_9CARY|nr:hypothetical protein Cgig2_018008 [Carnegiea gigantea]
MPRGIGKLSCLQKLPFFSIAEIASDKKWRQFIDQQEEIKALKNINGNLFVRIYIPTKAKFAMENGRKGGFLSQHLTKIAIKFAERDIEDVTRVSDIDEALLDDLQTHPNMRVLKLEWLQHLAVIGKLPKLKFLILKYLSDPEYTENTTISMNSSGVESQESFFPSLEKLWLHDLPNLKGDWGVENLPEVEEVFRGSSSSLQELKIRTCIGQKSVYGGLEHLTVLESLVLLQLPNLSLCEEGDQDEEEDGLAFITPSVP